MIISPAEFRYLQSSGRVAHMVHVSDVVLRALCTGRRSVEDP